MRYIPIAAAIASALLLASCGPSVEIDGPAIDAPPPGATTAPAGSENAELIEKEIGESGAFQCGDAQGNDCDVTFSVTSVSPTQCESETPGAGNEFVAFEVDVETAPQWRAETSSTALLWQNWGVVDPSGYLDRSPETALGCDLDMDPFYDELPAGVKMRGRAVVEAPEGTRTVRFMLDHVTWEWEGEQ